MSIYIANLHFSVTDIELRQLFEQYGAVKSVNLILDKKTKKSKGFAFVEIENNLEANIAIEEINQKIIRGRSTKVSKAKK